MLIRNVTVFYPSPGKMLSKSCLICGSECAVEKNKLESIYDPLNQDESLPVPKTRFDLFTCPLHAAPWHESALQQYKAMVAEPSPTLKATRKADLDALLLANKSAIDATKIGP